MPALLSRPPAFRVVSPSLLPLSCVAPLPALPPARPSGCRPGFALLSPSSSRSFHVARSPPSPGSGLVLVPGVVPSSASCCCCSSGSSTSGAAWRAGRAWADFRHPRSMASATLGDSYLPPSCSYRWPKQLRTHAADARFWRVGLTRLVSTVGLRTSSSYNM